MKKRVRLTIMIFTVLLFSVFSHGAIPASERAALIALYNSTNGDNWTYNSGWKTPPLYTDGFAMPGTEMNWWGVTTWEDHVVELYLRDNKLNGTIPYQLGQLNDLRKLNLSWNNTLFGIIPSELGNLGKLWRLDLIACNLSGGIPWQLGNLSNLEFFYMAFNHLGGAIPPELGNLSYVRQIDLSGNRLSGCIPSQLGNLSNLTALYINANRLSGDIPFQLGNLKNLVVLELGWNQLCSTIPSQFGNLSNLERLYLNDNQLKGSIPSQLGNLIHLSEFNLNNNTLSGSIPSELGNLRKCLQKLNFSKNRLSGAIPSNFINFTKISDLDIGYNCLYAIDSTLRTWLNRHDPDWEAHQNQCGSTSLPAVTTNSVSSITSTSAVCGGNVTLDGGLPVTARGICWSTITNPTVANSKTTDGSGLGNFNSNLIEMSPNTTYYVRAYATNIKGTAYGSNVSFSTTSSSGIPEISLNRKVLNFGTSIFGSVTDPQIVLVSNTGNGKLSWCVFGNDTWLYFAPSSGTDNSILAVSVNPVGLSAGAYSGTISIVDVNAPNSPQVITIQLQVYNAGTTAVPFGDFSTPIEGSSICNSVPVTGWTLDDIGVANVKIYNGDTYIGDATFVEGARPDIEAAYPGYPNNYKAGWGYMLLTQFLPGGGNGTYTLTAKATDMEGNEVTLGSKSITIDNTHAVKPFGAIDTPTQGGNASGESFVNYGWALTPQPNTIPADGSTLNVFIDGMNKGNPKYNVYRADIATLFPGYANSNGAFGYYYIDTTKLKNGLHTIAWAVSDTSGNSDGIGSRYFSVMNTQSISDSSKNKEIPKEDQRPESLEELYSEVEAKYIEIKEVERVEINLSDDILSNASNFKGYLVVGDQLRELPIGSTLDKTRGIFYWQPGPGFLGKYCFIFIGKNTEKQYIRKKIFVNIIPKH